jgi:hypothetical protein
MSWEVSLCHYLSKNGIVPNYTLSDKCINYNMDNKSSLRSILNKKNVNFSILVYELYSFVSTFKKYKFVHGNLNVDTVFVDNLNHTQFFIIDLSNSYVLGRDNLDFDMNTLRESLRSMFTGKPVYLQVIG